MYHGLFFADLHIGAMEHSYTYDTLENIRGILEEYKKENPIDFIIVGGDLFDKQLYANDLDTEIAIKIMVLFILSADVVRFINGTSSHDAEQYRLLHPFEELNHKFKELDFNARIINTVEEEELLPGLEVLYIPEEYIYDQGAYYKKYFKKKYDYVFGHGMIYEAFKGKIEKSKKNNDRMKAAVFNSSDLAKLVRGKVYFGHYHVHVEMNEGKVCYVGSFNRWQFGEEEDKGYYRIFCDPAERKYTDQFIVNEKALKYVTLSYGYKDSVFASAEDMEIEAKKITKIKLKHEIDFLRVIFNIPVGYENPEGLISFFRNYFKNNQGVSLEFNNGYVEEKKIQRKTSVKKLPEEYRVILDKNVPEEEKIRLFLKLTRNKDKDPAKIKKYLDKITSN